MIGETMDMAEMPDLSGGNPHAAHVQTKTKASHEILSEIEGRVRRIRVLLLGAFPENGASPKASQYTEGGMLDSIVENVASVHERIVQVRDQVAELDALLTPDG